MFPDSWFFLVLLMIFLLSQKSFLFFNFSSLFLLLKNEKALLNLLLCLSFLLHENVLGNLHFVCTYYKGILFKLCTCETFIWILMRRSKQPGWLLLMVLLSGKKKTPGARSSLSVRNLMKFLRNFQRKTITIQLVYIFPNLNLNKYYVHTLYRCFGPCLGYSWTIGTHWTGEIITFNICVEHYIIWWVFSIQGWGCLKAWGKHIPY